MTPLVALAGQAIPQPIVTIGYYAIGLVVLLGGATLILGLIFRGIQAKYGDAYVKATIKEWYTSEELKAEREAFARKVVSDWYGTESMREERERFTRRVIEDQLRRDDGLIRRDIEKAVTAVTAPVVEKLDELLAKTESAHSTYQQVLQRLSHIEGSVDVVKNAMRLSSPSTRMPPGGGRPGG